MSLLSQASLVVTPNAYKEGKLYSVIPSDGSGDFTFTRATTATRVNSDGLVELVPYNLVQRSEEFENAAWTKSNVTINANATTAPNGTLTADKLIANATIAQHATYTFGPSADAGAYTFSCYAKAAEYSFFSMGNAGGVSGGSIIFNLTNGTFSGTASGVTPSIESVGNGWYRCAITINTTPSFSWWILARNANNASNYAGNGTDGLFIWGAQLVEGTNALPYQKTETRLNIPRLDYSLGGCPNILLEPQRTNLTTYSEQFDDASWIKINSSVTANADISPDGYTNADRIYDNAASGQHRVGKNISVVSATTYTFSVFAKKGSLRYCYLLTTAGVASDRYYFDLQDGVSITAGGKIEDYGSGWYRISAQVTAAATGNELFAFNLTDSSSSPTYSGTGTGYHMIYGYQVEAGDYATSYIPTTSASVTRNNDVCDKTSATALIGQTEGTVLIDIDLKLNNRFQTLWSLSDGISTSDFILVYHTDVNTLSARMRTVGVDQINISTATLPQGRYKLAMAYKENDVAFYVNGSLVGTDNSCAVPSPLNKISLTQIGTAVNIREGFTKGFALWKERLTNDQLEALTGEGFNTYAEMANYYNYITQ
jgi:hypothetical protein